MIDFKVRDKIKITKTDLEGVIIDVGELREPSMKYAIDVTNNDHYDDIIFVGSDRLEKIEQ